MNRSMDILSVMRWLVTVWLLGNTAFAEPTPPVLQDVGFDQRLNQQVPLDLPFTDEHGQTVRLGDYFHEKPVILALVYYECPMLCTLVLNGLVQGMRDMPFTVGKEYTVVTISFDPRETPLLAAEKKKNYLARYGRPQGADGWHFLTGKADAIKAVTRSVGFRYVYDPRSKQFIHTSGLIVLTPQGKISRYFYGIQYRARDLRLGLVEASQNKIGTAADQVLLYCFHYDPDSGKYTASVLNFVRVGGIATVVILVGMVWFLVRAEHRRSGLRAGSRAAQSIPPEFVGNPSKNDHV